MSRGPGRIERGILTLLALSPENRLSRCQLEEALCEHRGHTSSNVLRAIRSLQRIHVVSFDDRADKSQACVELIPAKPVSNERVFGLLAELGAGRSQQAKPAATVRKGYSKHTRSPVRRISERGPEPVQRKYGDSDANTPMG